MSFDPTTFIDDFQRPDNFTATIGKVRLTARTFSRNSVKHGLYAKVDYELEPGHDFNFETWTEYYPAGFLTPYPPSNDGVTPAGGTMEDYKALAQGEAVIGEDEAEKYEGTTTVGHNFTKNTDWAQYLIALGDCGFKNWGAHADCIEGVKVELQRLPQTFKRKPKALKPGEVAQPEKEFKVLVPTKLVALAGAKGAAKKTTASKANGAGATAEVDPVLAADLAAAISDALEKAGGTATRGKLAGSVMNAFGNDSTRRASALSLYQNNDWLGNSDIHPWKLDGATLTMQ